MSIKKDNVQQESQLAHLADLITDLKEETSLTVLKSLLSQGVPPDLLLKSCMEGMRRVGSRFEQGRYFIAALIMAGEIMRRATEMIGPSLSRDDVLKTKGLVMIGTVQGDIHDLGKNLFASMLQIDSVEVVDLGVDVPQEIFCKSIKARMPDMVGLSCVLTSCLSSLKDTIEMLRSEFGNQCPPIIIGGACVDEKVRTFSNADYWASDVSEGLRIYRTLFNDK
jgi:methanogenic corrinoid protein MtbC1